MTAVKKPIPTWVAEQIAVKTGLDKTTLSRASRRTRCPRCQDATYEGLDAERCAVKVVVDRQPISALGEALALLAGMKTFERHSQAGRLVLDFRSPDYIESRPAGTTSRNDVHAAHVCGHQWPPAARAPTALPDYSLQANPTDPPF